MYRLRRAAAFQIEDWIVFVRALWILSLAEMAIHFMAPPRVLAWASSVRPGRNPALTEQDILRRAWLLNVAANFHIVRLKCLARSLALARLLGRNGVAARVRVGVRVDGGTLAAHAWVEWNGRTLNDSEDVHDRFAAFGQALGDVTRLP
jgi:hypothetical protein